MNKIKSLAIALFASAAALTSCSDYLEVHLEEQLTLDEVFSKRSTTLQYLRHIYSYLPYEAEYLMSNGEPTGGDGASVAISDEAHFNWTMWVPHLIFKEGENNPTTTNWNNWPSMYTGIEQAGVFMDNVDRCPQLSDKEKVTAKAEARFLRAYCYFQLFRRFGPVYIWGDRRADNTVHAEDIDRNTVDENVEFMISEIDKAAEDLPFTIENAEQMEGRITKGAALAAKSRILLYAASPLFNGCDLYKGKLMNKDGKYLFPQTPDPNKWELAAQAAKDVIDLNGGMYQLYEDQTETDPFLKAIKSYQGIEFKEWNSEIIWGCWPRCSTYNSGAGLFISYHWGARMCPKNIIKQGCSGYSPSLKLVDTYPMAESGRFPVTGYDGLKQIVDPKSGYVAEGFTSDWEHPIEGPQFGGVKAHNSIIGRDARFYASIFPSGCYWVNAFTIQGSKQIVTFHNGGTSSYVSNGGSDCCRVGYMWRRWLKTDNDYQNDAWGTCFYFFYRLGEIYLNYAEACNEKPNRDEAEALKYINKIRNRVNLNNIEEAYPEVIGNQALLRELIRKERMVELAFEGHRYYDCRRWMTATEDFNGLKPTLNTATSSYEGSYERSFSVWTRPEVFTEKNYFIPINQKQLDEMKHITQNYGW